LGLVQGLTEFLPISSSGHLVLGEKILGVKPGGLSFEIFIHLGTLFAVILIFRKRIGKMIGSLLFWHSTNSSSLHWIFYILFASIPTAIIGILFQSQVERIFNNVNLVSLAMIVTGILLYLTRFVREGKRELGLLQAFLIGLAQAIAILPGISRSGSTISVAFFCGMDEKEAVEFSFLLSIPAIIGASLLKWREAFSDFPNLFPLIIGMVTAFLSGYLAINVLLKIVKKVKLVPFSYYCWAVGILGIFVCELRNP